MELNGSLPKSEVWFWEKWRKDKMATKEDKPNKPRHGFIPDVFNRRHYYIIEIDGSSHLTQDSYLRDKRKNTKFQKAGYEVIRVEAYNESSYQDCVARVRSRRLSVDRTIERRREKEARRRLVLHGSLVDPYMNEEEAGR